MPCAEPHSCPRHLCRRPPVTSSPRGLGYRAAWTLAPPLLAQVPANVFWKAEDDGSSAWAAATHEGDGLALPWLRAQRPLWLAGFRIC